MKFKLDGKKVVNVLSGVFVIGGGIIGLISQKYKDEDAINKAAEKAAELVKNSNQN